MIVWPDKNVVAVFTGRGVDVTGDVALALAAALKGDEPLPPNREGNARLNTAIREASAPPPVRPVAPLPPMAEEVSGKMYRLELNQFDVKCIALRFDSPSDVWFDLSLGSGAFELPVGMDGVPRFFEHLKLELLLRIEVSKETALGHAGRARQRSDGELFEADPAHEIQRLIDDRCPGFFSLAHALIIERTFVSSTGN